MKKSVFTPEYASLRKELRSARVRAELTQREIATRLKVPHSWVAKVESGERRIDMIEFCWFITACGGDPLRSFEVISKQLASPRRKRGQK
jgi:transcriptional regulator with XRE-family HTH domain